MKLISFLFTFAAALGFASAARAGKKATLSEALRGSMEDRAEQRTDPPTLDREEALTKEPSTAPSDFLTKEPSTGPPTLDMKEATAEAEERKGVPALPLDRKGVPALPLTLEQRRNRILELLKEFPIGLRDIIADYVDCRLARVPRNQSELGQMSPECFQWGPCPLLSNIAGMSRLVIVVDNLGIARFWGRPNPDYDYVRLELMDNYTEYQQGPTTNCLLIQE